VAFFQVNELSDQPVLEMDGEETKQAQPAPPSREPADLTASALDDVNLHILQELEDDM